MTNEEYRILTNQQVMMNALRLLIRHFFENITKEDVSILISQLYACEIDTTTMVLNRED